GPAHPMVRRALDAKTVRGPEGASPRYEHAVAGLRPRLHAGGRGWRRDERAGAGGGGEGRVALVLFRTHEVGVGLTLGEPHVAIASGTRREGRHDGPKLPAATRNFVAVLEARVVQPRKVDRVPVYRHSLQFRRYEGERGAVDVGRFGAPVLVEGHDLVAHLFVIRDGGAVGEGRPSRIECDDRDEG